MPESFKRIPNSCFHLDTAGNPVFSVDDFIRLNGLPDDPHVHMVVIEELRQMDPDIRILDLLAEKGTKGRYFALLREMQLSQSRPQVGGTSIFTASPLALE